MSTPNTKAAILKMIDTLQQTLNNVAAANVSLKESLKRNGPHQFTGSPDSIHRLLAAIGRAQLASLDAAQAGLNIQLEQMRDLTKLL